MKKIKVKMDIYELRALIKCINEMRNKLFTEKKDTYAVDELLVKYFDLLQKQ